MFHITISETIKDNSFFSRAYNSTFVVCIGHYDQLCMQFSQNLISYFSISIVPLYIRKIYMQKGLKASKHMFL